MALIPRPNANIIEENSTLILVTDNKTIRLTKHISDSTIVFYFGGHEMYCVEVQIFRKTKDTPAFIDVSVGNLVQVYYNQECSLERNFKRGVDTKRLLQLAVSYIYDNYPYVKSLKFTDASTRTCEDESVVSLAEMSYVTTGKTWYQQHFNAFLSPKHESLFKKETVEFEAKKQQMTWNFIYPHIQSPLPEFKTIYESSKTWQEFFVGVRTVMGISEFCAHLSKWLHTFLEKFTSIRFLMLDFYLPIDNRLYVSYREQTYSKGGRRFTRRTKKISRINMRNAIV